MCSVNGATGSSGLVSLLGSDTGQGWECPGLSFSCYLFEHPCFCGMFQMDSVFEAEGRVGILRLSQRQCDLGGLLNKLNVYVCVAYSSACPETSENEGETVWESMEAFRAPGRGRGGEAVWGGKQLPLKSAHSSGCDRSGLPLILLLGWEPGREGPSAILSQLRTSAFPLKQINSCRAAVPSSSVSEKQCGSLPRGLHRSHLMYWASEWLCPQPWSLLPQPLWEGGRLS